MTNPWTSLLPSLPAESNLAHGADTRGAILTPLPSLAVLRFTGPESAKFLQGQTTTDFREIEKGRGLPGAICSLKGRVLFSFTAIPDGEDVLLVLPADQIEGALTHLKKYALFSKTQLSDASSVCALAGISGTEAAAHIKSLVGDVPAQSQVIKGADGIWATRPGPESRYLLGIPAGKLTAVLQQELTFAQEKTWLAADIRDGLATIFAASRDLFQPQELNYPAVEGVSYNKGCYTGQEIVARLYFRGKLKQRLYRFEAITTEPPAIGSNILAEGKPAGEVVIAAKNESGSVELLAVVKNQAVQKGALTLEKNGSAIRMLELPYELAADKEE